MQKPFNLYETYLQNALVVHEEQLYCHLCHTLLYFCWHTGINHVKEESHIEAKKQAMIPKVLFNSKKLKECQTVVLNCIVLTNIAKFYCLICECYLSFSFNNVDIHIKGRKHTSLKESFEFVYMKRTITPCCKPNNIYQLYFDNGFINNNNLIFCHLCKVFLSFSWRIAMVHINSRKHINMKTEKSTPSIVPSIKDCVEIVQNCIVYSKAPNYFYCYICCCNISGFDNIFTHIDGQRHEINEKLFELIDNKQIYTIENCSLYIPHNLQKFVYSSNIQIFQSRLYCVQCDVNMLTDGAVQNHLETHY